MRRGYKIISIIKNSKATGPREIHLDMLTYRGTKLVEMLSKQYRKTSNGDEMTKHMKLR